MIRKQGCNILWAGQNENTLYQRLKSQCDLIGYPVAAKKQRGHQVGVTYVYQNGTYLHPGARKKMLYKDLHKFWDAYDTYKMIKSETISKNDLYQKKIEIQQEEIFDAIMNKLIKDKSTTITLMEVKQLMTKKLKIDWDLKKINENISLMAPPDPNEKNRFSFADYI